MHLNFSEGYWTQKQVTVAHPYRFAEAPDFTQEQNCIRSATNPNHPEGYDNVSIMSREAYKAGATVTVRCSFAGLGCPEIMVMEDLTACEDGSMRYGTGFEIALYENGINVWRHDRENGKCSWYQRLGVEFPVKEHSVHILTTRVLKNMLEITLNGQKTLLYTPDLPEKFYLGVTACEGVVYIYDMEITP